MFVPPEAYMLMGAIIATALAPLLLKPSRDEVVSSRFWFAATYLVGFVLRPWFILAHQNYGHGYIRFRPDFPQLVVDGLVVALLGLLVFWVGYVTRLGSRLAGTIPILDQEISPRRWRQAVLGCLLIGLVGYAVFLKTAGGIRQLLAILYMRAAVYEADETLGPMKEIAKFVGVAGILGMHYNVAIKRVWWAWPLLLLSSAIVGTMGSRGAVIQLWLAAYMIYALLKPRYRSWKVLGALALIAMVFASAALGFRRGTKAGAGSAAAALADLSGELTKNLVDSVPMFDHMVSAVVATDRDFTRLEGLSYVQLLPVMVPRSLWPVETETAGVTLRKAIEPTGMGGRPASMMGEGYMNFGLLGALVPMFFLGIWCRAIHSFMVRNEGRSRIVPLFYTYLLLGTPRILTGVLPLALRELIMRLAAVAVAFFWAARRPAQQAAPAEQQLPAASGE